MTNQRSQPTVATKILCALNIVARGKGAERSLGERCTTGRIILAGDVHVKDMLLDVVPLGVLGPEGQLKDFVLLQQHCSPPCADLHDLLYLLVGRFHDRRICLVGVPGMSHPSVPRQDTLHGVHRRVCIRTWEM